MGDRSENREQVPVRAVGSGCSLRPPCNKGLRAAWLGLAAETRLRLLPRSGLGGSQEDSWSIREQLFSSVSSCSLALAPCPEIPLRGEHFLFLSFPEGFRTLVGWSYLQADRLMLALPLP